MNTRISFQGVFHEQRTFPYGTTVLKKLSNSFLTFMYNQKDVPSDWMVAGDWAWAYPTYDLELTGVDASNIASITIDPKGFMADVNRANNMKTM